MLKITKFPLFLSIFNSQLAICNPHNPQSEIRNPQYFLKGWG